MANGDGNSNVNETSASPSSSFSPSKRTTAKSTTLADVESSTNIPNNSNNSLNNDNRIKFIDMLVCGSCQQDFQLSDIVKFIEHKAKCGNKENKPNIPYHYPQRRRRQGEGDDDEEEGDDEEDEDDDHEFESQHRQQKAPEEKSNPAKILADTNGHRLNNSGEYKNSSLSSPQCPPTFALHLFIAEPYNFKCSQCGDIYRTGRSFSEGERERGRLDHRIRPLAWFLVQHYHETHGLKMYSTCHYSNTSVAPLSKRNDRKNRSNVSTTQTPSVNVNPSSKETSSSSRSASNSNKTSAKNSTRTVQQQSNSTRSRAEIPSNSRVTLPTGINGKNSNVSTAASAITPTPASLLEELARSNPLIKLFQEMVQQPAASLTPNEQMISETSAETQFLTPKSLDETSLTVRVLSLTRQRFHNFFPVHSRSNSGKSELF